MKKARHRALTQVFFPLLTPPKVEMKKARHRALTRDSMMETVTKINTVEMKKARHRALTQARSVFINLMDIL